MKLENEFTVPASVDEAWAFLLDVPRVAPCLPGATVDPETDEDGTYRGVMKIKIGPITAQYKGTVRIQSADEENHTVAMRAQAKDARGQGSASATITSKMEETAEGTKVSVVTDMRVTGPAAQFGRGVMQDVSAKLMSRFADCLADELSGAKEAAASAGEPEVTEADTTESDEVVASDVPATDEAPADDTSTDEPAAAEATTAPGVVAESAPSASSGVSSAEPQPEAPSASSGTSSAEAPSASSARPTDDVLDLGEAAGGAVLKRALPLVGAAVALLILIRIIRR